MDDGGKALAAWLAENVMGWHLSPTSGRYWHNAEGRHAAWGWDPLHNNEQAMMVARHMVAELGWEFRCGRYILGPSKFWANFSRSSGSRSVQGNSLNSAICRAAKIAIETEPMEQPMACAYCGSVLE